MYLQTYRRIAWTHGPRSGESVMYKQASNTHSRTHNIQTDAHIYIRPCTHSSARITER